MPTDARPVCKWIVGPRASRIATMPEELRRRLAAILAADAVGYSRLMEDDEEGALARLKQCRRILDEAVERFHGRVFGGAGDSIVAEFASPVEAVRCSPE